MKTAFRGVALAAALAVGGPVVFATAAQAATEQPVRNPHLAQTVCGFQHSVVDSDPILRPSDGAEVARVYLLRAQRTGATCVTTIKSAFFGTLTRTVAALGNTNAPVQLHDAQELVYAGPVRESAPQGTCVFWGGHLVDPVTGEWYHHAGANPAIGWNATCF